MTEFADLPEHQATGRIAEIYDEIRLYGAVPYVSSLQRQLATIPGCLEWVWEAVRPAFVDGSVPLAAWGAVEDLDLPAIAPIPRPALRVLGVSAEGETALHSIYETFLRASPVNMVTASLMARMLDGVPDKSPANGDDARSWQPPPPPPALPSFPPESAFDAASQSLLELFEVDMDGARFVPGLYRLLAHWPPYLAHVAVEIVPLFRRDDVVEICSQIVTRIDSVVPPLAKDLSAGPVPFDSETADALRGSLRVYRGLTSPQMIVFSAILKDALPAASSI
ncbi:MAG: hypothetical protein QGH07_08240 [Alphaproteobacteria bacterium]|nr:hypothetical protein [Alphaproteobacteria bacterium]